MSDEAPDGMNPDDDLPPDVQHTLNEFEKIMKDINDPVENGYKVIAEMYNGLRTVGLKHADAAILVVTYIMMHDYLTGTSEQDKS
jgi:hypothetical protein